jgi:F-type H+-transporting ATPase subunit b
MGFNVTTFVFEIVNFLVLLLLGRFVYRPLRRGIAARRQALQEREAEAKRLSAEAASLKAELDGRAQAIDDLRAQALRDASVAAADERARILEQAREDAAADRARAQHLIEAEHESSEAAIRELAITHATSLAGKLLTQLAPEALQRALFEALLGEVEDQATAWKGDGDLSPDEEVEVTWAKLPGEAELARLRAALQPLELVHREDPSLGAGAVLRYGHRVLDASTAGQLSAFRARARALIELEEGQGHG